MKKNADCPDVIGAVRAQDAHLDGQRTLHWGNKLVSEELGGCQAKREVEVVIPSNGRAKFRGGRKSGE